MDIPSNKEDKTNSVHLSGSAELLILRQKEILKLTRNNVICQCSMKN